MTTAPLMTVEVMSDPIHNEQEFDYQLITDLANREWAESAAGFITFGLGQAVLKVLEAGNLLAEAKLRLPHGQYLPWVERACGLKPSNAQRLIKAAEWANAAHARHLDGVTDVTTLFLLSADTTTEEVREWFMERCAAGDPPTRNEVQERKRTAGQPRAPQPAEAMALSILRKGEMDRIREALTLAERAQVVTADQVMAEQRLRELGKQRFIAGADADFHRMKDGRWIRLPHAGRIDVEPKLDQASGDDQIELLASEVLTVNYERAAEILDCAESSIRQRLSPKKVEERGVWRRNGYIVTKAARGMVNLEQER